VKDFTASCIFAIFSIILRRYQLHTAYAAIFLEALRMPTAKKRIIKKKKVPLQAVVTPPR
jgi:hypothetical protein